MWVAGDAGQRMLRLHSRAGEGEGARTWLAAHLASWWIRRRMSPWQGQPASSSEGLPADCVLVGIQLAGGTYPAQCQGQAEHYLLLHGSFSHVLLAQFSRP